LFAFFVKGKKNPPCITNISLKHEKEMLSLGPQMLGAQRGRDIQEMLSQVIHQGLWELGTDVE